MPIAVRTVKPEFVDQRGFISRIIDQEKIKIRSVLVIGSKKNSVRGNHYHKKDAHFVYCFTGKFKYSEKDVNRSNSKIISVILKPGDLVLTKPMFWHRMEFLEKTVFLAFTTETRKQSLYEADTVRLINEQE